MRIIGKGVVIKIYGDDNREIIGIARLVMNLTNGRQLIITPTSTLRETIHDKQVKFTAEKYELQKNGKGFVAVRDEQSGKFKLTEFSGTADVVIEKA